MPQLTWKADNLPWDLPPDYTMISTSNETEEQVNAYKLDQNYPNPFNPATNISFTLPNAADVNLAVYNMLGQKVATLISGKTMTQGVHSVSFDASSLASGIYIYRLEAGSFVSNKRMTLIK
ncbi:MAG: T9SS type A sorting domain-containing protein [Balneolaceae bacterium]|nr:T9SS type A sorting domain-containing protein [Balneolaceae bacterium]MBO6546619.1 T9SS type A sorting domain-containing protein [Balneolaceae bacterium]MBO6648977.1 T9SS type A sorting domain-containing protein [Balneolaceae bacterium]